MSSLKPCPVCRRSLCSTCTNSALRVLASCTSSPLLRVLVSICAGGFVRPRSHQVYCGLKACVFCLQLELVGSGSNSRDWRKLCITHAPKQKNAWRVLMVTFQENVTFLSYESLADTWGNQFQARRERSRNTSSGNYFLCEY